MIKKHNIYKKKVKRFWYHYWLNKKKYNKKKRFSLTNIILILMTMTRDLNVLKMLLYLWFLIFFYRHKVSLFYISITNTYSYTIYWLIRCKLVIKKISWTSLVQNCYHKSFILNGLILTYCYYIKKKKIKTEIVGLKHNHLEFGLKLIIIIKIQKRTRYGNNIK